MYKPTVSEPLIMAEAPVEGEEETLKRAREDPPDTDSDDDEHAAAARVVRPRGAVSAVRPGVECPYMDTISRQVGGPSSMLSMRCRCLLVHCAS